MTFAAQMYRKFRPYYPFLGAASLSIAQFISSTDLMIITFKEFGLETLLPVKSSWLAVVSCIFLFMLFMVAYVIWRAIFKTFIKHDLLEDDISSNDPMSFSSVLSNAIYYHDSKIVYLKSQLTEQDLKNHIENVLIDLLLYNIRHAFSNLYGHPGFCVSIFLPMIHDGNRHVMFEAYTTKFDQKHRRRLEYNEKEGFCGWAWATNEPQAGSKRKTVLSLLSIKDKRYYNKDGLQHNNSFLCLPISVKQHRYSDNNASQSVLAILSIDSRIAEDFKCRHSVVKQLDGSLKEVCAFVFELINEGKLTLGLRV